MNTSNTTVLLFGSFDTFHPGHDYLITQARGFGKRIIISVAQDSIILKMKNKAPVYPMNTRIENLQNRYPDTIVIPGDIELGKWISIIKYKPDIIVLGYDQSNLRKALLKIQPKYGFNIKEIPAFKPKQYKSSLLRKK